MLLIFSTPGDIATGSRSRSEAHAGNTCVLTPILPNLRFNVDDVRVLYTASTALESVLSYLAGDLSFTVGEVTLTQQQLGMPTPSSIDEIPLARLTFCSHGPFAQRNTMARRYPWSPERLPSSTTWVAQFRAPTLPWCWIGSSLPPPYRRDRSPPSHTFIFCMIQDHAGLHLAWCDQPVGPPRHYRAQSRPLRRRQTAQCHHYARLQHAGLPRHHKREPLSHCSPDREALLQANLCLSARRVS